MATLLLIDGNNLFHRAYHALPPLNSKDGINANAVYGFSNMLLKAIAEVNPDYIACAFDTAAATFRHVEFEKYKAHRPPPPPDLYPQLPKVKGVLDAFDIKYFEKEGFEADDLLASIANAVNRLLSIDNRKRAIVDKRSTIDIVILSGDRDVLQLVDGYIKVQMPGWNLKDTTLFGRKEVIAKFGIEPRQMVDYKSLVGDASDNIPGVAGVGPKTAADLLVKYDNLEVIYERLDEINPKVAEKLRTGREIALAAKRLVELDLNVNLEFELSNLEFKPNWDKVRSEYEQLGFKSIAAKIPRGANESMNNEPSTNNSSDQLELI